MADESGQSRGTNQGRTLERALDVLECVGESRQPMSLTQISRSTGLHVATTQRLIRTLVRRDYLTASTLGYSLGPRVLAHAHSFVLQDRLTRVSQKVLTDLTAATSLTSSVFVRSGGERILIARVEAPDPLSYYFPVGQKLPLRVGGGKVLLAYLDEEDRGELLAAEEDTVLADGRMQTVEQLERDLESVRADGYFISTSERHTGTVSITAPVWGPEGELLAAINLVAHHGTLDAEGMSAHRTTLMQASRLITSQV
ncbi:MULTISPECIES: IclR family transcriptional regulator [Brevibacterium]|uniref:IclR family transcriptional regulator n=1 Tax=Brevibacterium salitolerans TaxID=1403566 RepID=A0ABN2WMJ0_9MICO|nr:IclR family transcriptional regulator [Brevibacterium sp.]